uniref:Putative secreted protein n=1 Tax=Anopheles triannulatus TaxID=58253 RepID=A0A2M4B6N3_9DIPT
MLNVCVWVGVFGSMVRRACTKRVGCFYIMCVNIRHTDKKCPLVSGFSFSSILCSLYKNLIIHHQSS